MHSYTPGSWSDVKLSDYNIPKTTSIMLVGPKGAGKSSLVNKITRVIEDDAFLLDRAQESCKLSIYVFAIVSILKVRLLMFCTLISQLVRRLKAEHTLFRNI